MKCVDVEKLMGEFADGELDFASRQKIASHLQKCTFCQSETGNLQNANYLLRNLPPIAPSKQFDGRMMQAFQKHQETKSKPNFWTTVFAAFSISKSALAFGALILIAFTTLAFQLGRISVSNNEVADNKTDKSVTPVIQIVEKQVEVPVIKTVEVPVYKERIVNRIVYRNRNLLPKSEFARTRQSSIVDSLNNTATFIQTSGESFTPLNLKDFQPISEVKISIIKREENER